jgi:hypothetical protein
LLAWGTVRAGLALVVIGSILLMVGAGILVIKQLTELAGIPAVRRPPTTALEAIAEMFVGAAIVVGGVMSLVGGCMGAAAPGDSGAKGPAIAFCGAVGVLFVLAGVLVIASAEAVRPNVPRGFDARGFNPRVNPWEEPKAPWSPDEIKTILYAYALMSVLAVACYCLHLRGVARFFNRDALAAGILAYLLIFVLFCCGLVVFAVTQTPGGINPARAELMIWLPLGGIVALSVWFIVLAGLVRGAVTRGLLRAT